MEHQEGTESMGMAAPAGTSAASLVDSDIIAASLGSRLRALRRSCAAMLAGVAMHALVICAAAALGMLARWPRRTSVPALLRRRGLPRVERGPGAAERP